MGKLGVVKPSLFVTGIALHLAAIFAWRLT
jgi:hypothetical protein